MFPAIVLVIPLYTIFSQLGLRNSIEGLLIVYTATTLPVAIYMLQGYFKSIPKELEEAAILDRLSWFGIITKIIIPLINDVAQSCLERFMQISIEEICKIAKNKNIQKNISKKVDFDI